MRFHLGQICAITLKPLIPTAAIANPLHRSNPARLLSCESVSSSSSNYGDLIVTAAEARGAVAGIRRGIRAGQDPLEVAATTRSYNRGWMNSLATSKRIPFTLMGQRLGQDFSDLMQDAARLHVKWNEFLPMYAGPKAGSTT